MYHHTHYLLFRHASLCVSSVCMWYTGMHVCACVCMYMWRAEADAGSFSTVLHLRFGDTVIESGVHSFVEVGGLTGSSNLPSLLP